MWPALFARFACVVAALLTASLILPPSFLRPGAKSINLRPAMLVNRTLKGDRLPPFEPIVRRHELGLPASPAPSELRAKAPVGCEAAFSPISSPRLANVFRRCMT